MKDTIAGLFSPNAASPIAQAAGIPNLVGRLGLVKSADNPDRTAQAAHFRLFAPRLGLAYRLNNKTVVRSGYGIFYVQNIPDGAGGAQLTLLTQSWVPTVDGSLTSVATLSNPFPGGLRPAKGASRGLASNLGQAAAFLNTEPVSGTLTVLEESQRLEQRRITLEPATINAEGKIEPRKHVERVRVPALKASGVRRFKSIFEPDVVNSRTATATQPSRPGDTLLENNTASA